jgi:hypothetical protein
MCKPAIKTTKNKPRYFNSAQAMQTCIVSASRSLKKCDIHPAQNNNPSEKKNKSKEARSRRISHSVGEEGPTNMLCKQPFSLKERKISTPVPRDMHVENKKQVTTHSIHHRWPNRKTHRPKKIVPPERHDRLEKKERKDARNQNRRRRRSQQAESITKDLRCMAKES